MSRGTISVLLVFGGILCVSYIFDRAELLRLFSGVREFVSEHTIAVMVGLFALVSARLMFRSPHQIDRL